MVHCKEFGSGAAGDASASRQESSSVVEAAPAVELQLPSNGSGLVLAQALTSDVAGWMGGGGSTICACFNFCDCEENQMSTT
mgnify:CR=1 FL=1